MLIAIFNEFRSSIKSFDTEEKLDLVLYRPFGFLIAKIAWFFKMTPTMLSLMGLAFGFLSSLYFLDNINQTSTTLGSFFLILSGIFDSSDGQLARISNQTTKLGLILDGICDSLVTISVYVACAWPYYKLYELSFAAVVVAGLYLHSCHCAILDFYHREYLFFGYGKTEDETYWNPSLADGLRLIEESLTKKEKVMNKLRLNWIKKQQWLTSRTDKQRMQWKEKILSISDHEKENFMIQYRQHNLWLLPYWRLVGVNAHTALIIVFMFLRRFDAYLIAFDLVVFNLIIFSVGTFQKKSDLRFMKKVGLS